MLDTLITSKTRMKMLLKFFMNKHSRAYLRELATEFGESTNSVRVELNNLTKAGYLKSDEQGRSIYYSVNTKHPLYPEIKNLIHKYLGIDKIVDTVVNKVLQRLGSLKLAFITGDYAEGRDSGIIDLVMVGTVDAAYLQECVAKVEKLIHRKVRTLLLSEVEFEKNRINLQPDKAILLWQAE